MQYFDYHLFRIIKLKNPCCSFSYYPGSSPLNVVLSNIYPILWIICVCDCFSGAPQKQQVQTVIILDLLSVVGVSRDNPHFDHSHAM